MPFVTALERELNTADAELVGKNLFNMLVDITQVGESVLYPSTPGFNQFVRKPFFKTRDNIGN